MNGHPFISVIVPCYNQGQYLPEALQSVLDQSYAQWECIIINDGATDNTEKVALEWVAKDERFKYFTQPNSGLSAARNKGIDESKGTYIQFLDADDIITPVKFSESLVKGENADVIITDFKMFTQLNKGMTAPSFRLGDVKFDLYHILLEWDDKFAIPIHCGLFSSKIFDNIRFNEVLWAKEDWVMWLQIYQQAVKTVYIDEAYAMYRATNGSMTKDSRHMRKNLVLAYQIIYKMIPEEYREIFFNRATEKLENLTTESEKVLFNTRKSKSFKIGNFFVKNVSRFLGSK